MSKQAVGNKKHEGWVKTPLTRAIAESVTQEHGDNRCESLLAELETKGEALDHDIQRQGESRRQAGTHYRTAFGSDKGKADVHPAPCLSLEAGANTTTFGLEESDGPQLGCNGQLSTNPQAQVYAGIHGHSPNRAHRRRKRFRKIPNPPDKALLTDEEAAYVLDLEPESLAVFRSTGRHGIPYIKIGRNVRYRRSDLEAWLISRTHLSDLTFEVKS